MAPKKRIVRKKMVRRSSPARRVVYRKAPARRRSSSRGGFGGIMGSVKQNFIPGALAGVAAPIVNKYVPGWGGAIAYGGVGYFMKNPTLMTLSGIAAGQNVAPMVGNLLPGGSGTTSGGFL